MTDPHISDVQPPGIDLSARMSGRIRVAGTLLLLGLGVEVASLLWPNPTAFIVFVGAGGLLLGAGVGSFLISLVTVR